MIIDIKNDFYSSIYFEVVYQETGEVIKDWVLYADDRKGFFVSSNLEDPPDFDSSLWETNYKPIRIRPRQAMAAEYVIKALSIIDQFNRDNP